MFIYYHGWNLRKTKMEKENYRKFSKKMYEWSKDECDRKQLITAIYLYVYLNRERGEQTDETDRR